MARRVEKTGRIVNREKCNKKMYNKDRVKMRKSAFSRESGKKNPQKSDGEEEG